jgi:flagellar FliL protein
MSKDKESLLDNDHEVQIDEPATRGKRILLLLIPIIIALIAAIVYAAVTYFKGKESEKKENAASQTLAKSEYIYVEMEDIIVSLTSSNTKKNFLKISLSLQIKDKSSADIITTKLPIIRDSFQVFLRELRPSDLSGSAGVIMLKNELLKRVNKIAAPQEVIDVLFEEILLS